MKSGSGNFPWECLPVILAAAKWSFDALKLFGLRDQILQTLFEQHREVWESLGRPGGRLWRPRGEKSAGWGWAELTLWKRGSKIENLVSVDRQFRLQLALGKHLNYVDFPLLILTGIVAALTFTTH
jgi:hypothetical protein